jgi:hypothetical protein
MDINSLLYSTPQLDTLLSNPKRKLDSSELPNTVKSKALPVKKQRVTRKEKAGKILSKIPDIKSIKFDLIKMSEP